MSTARFVVAGEVRVPGDKSISHRALICASLATGTSRIRGILRSADVLSTAEVLRALGVAIPELTDDVSIQGVGPAGLRSPGGAADCGNSGTTARLMAGVVAGAGLDVTFTGDASLSRRPMRRVKRPLEAMGASVELPPHGGLPMRVRGTALHDLVWEGEIASAQVKSCILLASLCASVEVTVREPEKSRDHTERMLAAMGAEVWVNDDSVILFAGQTLTAMEIVVPGDPSSASFFAALAALAPAGDLWLRDVGLNDTRTGFLGALRDMGARVDLSGSTMRNGEYVGDLHVLGGEVLRGITVEREAIPRLIDELPLLACVAAYCDGTTTVTGAAELRVKESDRIAAVVGNLSALGADISELEDGFVVRGTRPRLRGTVTTHGDHRLAMAFGILAALPGNEIAIDDRDCVAVSYPTFWADLHRVTANA
ncbi:MAG: 3-phosphoshikimate 1-carboxyvinyltransferase [Gemmatimonadetes bacterium]|nr:3-phosphoshikimate 1-carboxyvinyltransferase [Gemmatimonadota bacterium]